VLYDPGIISGVTGVKTVYRFALAMLALLMGATVAAAPTPEQHDPGMEDWVEAGAALAEEFLDPDFLDALEKGDRQTVEHFLERFSGELQSDYVLDLAEMETLAGSALAIMERYEETQPYAVWLKARLDYFKMADRIKKLTPPPKPAPGKPPPNPSPPSPAKQRELWVEQIRKEPAPPRARQHLDAMKKIFRQEKVPPELVWIAEVESSFDSRARSPAGAAGMFQLMPATAKRFGLRTFPLDERYRPNPSATAAAKYLRYLHQKFGDWRLAIAAYNAGEGRVSKAREKSLERSFDAIAAKLPAETQLYVPKVEATVLRREGLKLDALGR